MRKIQHKSGSTATYIDGVYQTDDGYVIPDWAINPKDWQEITKDYEILKNAWPYATITSVKRLSDGEVFGVSEDVEDGGKILKLKETNKGIVAECEHRFIWLRHLRKSRKPILTSEDGVELFEGDERYCMDTITFEIECFEIHPKDPLPDTLYFSTREAAEEYRVNNARVLSYIEAYTFNPKQLQELVKSRLS